MFALLGVWSWYASRPALVWYVSPPLGPQRMRLRLIVPGGWSGGPVLVQAPSETLGGGPESIVVLKPRVPIWARWIPWLKWTHEDPALIALAFAEKRDPSEHTSVEQYDSCNRGLYSIAERTVVSRDNRFVTEVAYFRADRRAFDATHSAICNSLRIE